MTPPRRVALVEAASPLMQIYRKLILPRVGLPTIAAILKRAGYHVDLYFQAVAGFDPAALRGYDVVGIGSLTNTAPAAYALADGLREHATVVMGGPHASFMPEEALEHSDYVVRGEGEGTFLALLEALSTGRDAREVPGLALKNGSGIVDTGPPAQVDYAELPSPDFTLSPQITPETIPPIVTSSRGCPHDCCFCSVTALYGRRYRFKAIDQVLQELEPILNRSVNMADDNFCANPRRTKELLREMIAKDRVPKRWSSQMTVKASRDGELLDLMRRARCRAAYVGIESVRPETLKQFGKAHEVEAIGKSIESYHRHGIGVHGMFVVDVADPVDAPQAIVDYALKHDIDSIQIFPLTPFPGTSSFDTHSDRLLHREWEYYDGMHVVVRPEKCTPYELQCSIADAMGRFYSFGRFLTSYRRRRGWRMKYRIGGHLLLRRWLRENRHYFDRLKGM